MYVAEPGFVVPEDESVTLWRYMDLPQFVSLLHSRTIYFCALPKLEDVFEGRMTKPSKLANQAATERTLAGRPKLEELRPWLLKGAETLRPTFAVNCWHMNEHQSAAMWGLHANSGLAIRTTFRRLCDAFSPSKDDVFVGMVRYMDYSTEEMQAGAVFDIAMSKRLSYEHEREVRALVWSVRNETIGGSVAGWGNGVLIPIDVNTLIEFVYINPADNSGILKDAVSAIVNRFGYGFPVEKSGLNDPNLY